MRIWIAGLIVLLAAGCHAQVPPATAYQVNLTWQANPANNCTTANPCTYAVYRSPQVSGACQAFNLSAWTEITTVATRPSGTSYVDPTATGSVCYNVETVQTMPGQTSPSNSGPSNNALVTIPTVPLAPTLNGSPTVASNVSPLPASSQQLAMASVGELKAIVRR